MTTTATPGTDLAVRGARTVTRPAGDRQLVATDVEGIRKDLAAYAQPIAQTEPKPSPLDNFSLHTGGTALATVLATSLAVSLTGAPVLVRAASASLALLLIVLSILGLVACARRACARTQGR